eukprot:GHVU01022872.1.p1 GENE.GHVU01022872.1~~GHVU01022872.1.p1  ORF type:complete len:146 (-),score=0.31 GHVU01022872.1:1122-1559(-)
MDIVVFLDSSSSFAYVRLFVTPAVRVHIHIRIKGRTTPYTHTHIYTHTHTASMHAPVHTHTHADTFAAEIHSLTTLPRRLGFLYIVGCGCTRSLTPIRSHSGVLVPLLLSVHHHDDAQMHAGPYDVLLLARTWTRQTTHSRGISS